MTVLRLYGKATGNGPWHLMATREATKALCGCRAHFHGLRLPDVTHKTRGKAQVCRPCRAAERSTI